ncbi:endonuclease/exonuclease/phosphatase family protein [Cribrihabitans pelagius]|uniref:endonuclease/exonuclease/phosphatase family protein n=1 Tax=Cribrihabitans pelagius TaxID=1765746 RepID=UPI003B5CA7E8
MRRLAARLLLIAAAAQSGAPGWADSLRIATFNTELSRRGPGLLLRDILRGEDPQVAAVVTVIAAARPDVLVLQGVDWDAEGRTLAALQQRLGEAGAVYPHRFLRQPNAGLPVEPPLDMDGDGRIGDAGDAQGYGRFRGDGGLAVLSRLPLREAEAREFSALLWRDLPGADLPRHEDGRPFPSSEAQAVQRLSSAAHWLVPIELPEGGRLNVMAFQAGTPLFDGPEDRNGRRNADEIRLWQHLLDGALGPAPEPPFVIAGGANLDPERGAGRREAIRALLADPRLQDPRPGSREAGTATVEWKTAGEMRVDYLLPSAGLSVTGAGVIWPQTPQDAAAMASRHRLVWVDLDLP